MIEKTDGGFREVTEGCPSCEKEVTLRWDTVRDGLKAYCPYCGGRLMLCSECDECCDFDTQTDSCRYNPPPSESVKEGAEQDDALRRIQIQSEWSHRVDCI